jgi:hypothetical protein
VFNGLKGSTWRMNAPLPRNAAGAHFGCTLLEGVELHPCEDGISGSMWNKRFMFNDIMSADSVMQDLVVSPITWAMIEATGWYEHTLTN